jgi:histidinol-phosphate/aromatic aminotransferase/cobyric acid decarboxylase-like protein
VFVRSPISIDKAFDRLLAAGLIVRPIGLDEGYFRITVGMPPDNDKVLAELAAMAK